jgi:L-alanine-DL-glutamate epimerase-like enolase superfamily enzyme
MQFPDTPAVHLTKVQAFVYRAPIAEVVQTSFGIMHDRPSVLVRVEDSEGAHGWGEIWCNFPGVGAEHRARMLESCIAPVLLGRQWQSPTDAFAALTRHLAVLAIQTGEPGPIAQAIAGADIALWDLVARKLGQPLWRLFNGQRRIHAYASGISPADPVRLADVKHAQGYRAFKLKVGFGEERDTANLRALRDHFGPGMTLMVDANQAWDLPTATHMGRQLAPFEPAWVEEPLRADTPLDVWKRLADGSPLPLAGGENFRGRRQFEAAIASGAFSVIQPDLGKWGGFSGCLPVAHHTVNNNRMFCPHWLGGGVGLAAAMQLKAAVGQPGYVEVDSNPNPLRDLFAAPLLRIDEGGVTLPDSPGLGVEPDQAVAREFLVSHSY